MDTWAELERALQANGVDDETHKTIKGIYESQGGMTMSQLEQLLSDSGVPESVTRNITTDIEGQVTVDLQEMDYWEASLGLLIWIGENTGEIAKQLGASYADWNKFAAFAPGVFDWAGAFSGGLGRQAPTGNPLPVTDGTGGGGGSYDANGLLKVGCYEFGIPHEAWQGTVGLKVYNANIDNIWSKVNSYLIYLTHVYNRLYDLRVGGTVAVSGGTAYRTVSIDGSALTYLSWIHTSLDQIEIYTYKSALNAAKLLQGFYYWDPGRNFPEPQYKLGGIATGPETGYQATLHGTELVVSPKDSYPATVLSNGGTNGASGEEIELLKELIDTLRAKDTSPKVQVNVDGESIMRQAGNYVSERTRRGTLEVRAS